MAPNLCSPSTTEDDIQDRYCRCWLGIVNSDATVEAYDDKRVQQEWSILPRESKTSRPPHQPNPTMEPAQPNALETLPLRSTPSLVGYQEAPQISSVYLQDTVVGPATPEMPPAVSPPPLSWDSRPSVPSSLHSHKRARGNSFESSMTMATSRYIGGGSYTNFSRPQLQRLEMQLRDSGFFSSSSASDATSLLSRMSRLSIDVKLCTMDHKLVGHSNSCPICRYPEVQPKPLLYVPPEYAEPQRNTVDEDEMDNGILTRNANELVRG
jgi:hypothetical protein